MKIVLNRTWEVEDNKIVGLTYREFLEKLFSPKLKRFLRSIKMPMIDYLILSEMIFHKVIDIRHHRCLYIDGYSIILIGEYVIVYNKHSYMFMNKSQMNVGICAPGNCIVIQEDCHVEFDENEVLFVYKSYQIKFTVVGFLLLVNKTLKQ